MELEPETHNMLEMRMIYMSIYSKQSLENDFNNRMEVLREFNTCKNYSAKFATYQDQQALN